MARARFYFKDTVVYVVGTNIDKEKNEMVVWIDTPWDKLPVELQGRLKNEAYRQGQDRKGLRKGFTVVVKERLPTQT